jgi:hypothetical protein
MLPMAQDDTTPVGVLVRVGAVLDTLLGLFVSRAHVRPRMQLAWEAARRGWA